MLRPSQELITFVRTLDNPPRDDDYLKPILACFMKNDISEVVDLHAFDPQRLTDLPNTEGKRGFIIKAVEKAEAQAAQVSALVNSVRKAEPAALHIDVAARLKEITLAGTSHLCAPQGHLVDALATDAQKLTAKGIVAPFVYADLSKYLPPWCISSGTPQDQDDEQEPSQAVRELAHALGATAKQKPRLNMFQWQLAYDQYALSASVADQWKYVSAMAHKTVCLQVAHNAEAKNRRHALAVIYDELARMDWSRRAYNADPTFNRDVVCLKVDDVILGRAEKMYDHLNSTGKGGGKGSNKSSWKRPWNAQQHYGHGDHAYKQPRRLCVPLLSVRYPSLFF